MKKVIFFFLLIGGGAAYYFLYYQQQQEQNQVISYTAVPVSVQDIGTSVLATGIVKPQVGAEVRIGSQVSGVVQKLHVNIGDQVTKGDLLAEIDPAQFIANRDQALALLKNVEADLEYIQSNFKRQEQLHQEQVISHSEFDQSKRNLAIAETEVERQKANLQLLEIQLSLTKIYATISGVVASISTQEGETVISSFSSATFVTLIDLNRLEVWAYVDETDIGQIKAFQPVRFTVDTYPDTEFQGVVTGIYPKAELKDNVVNYITIVKIKELEGKILRPEMTATLNIIQEVKLEVTAVPNRAVKRDGSARVVYVQNGELIEKRAISIGIRDNKFTEILSGLKKGERVILEDVIIKENKTD